MSKPAAKNQQIGDFVLNNEAEYPWTVYPEVPGPHGKRLKMRIGVTFKHLTTERRIEILDEYRDRLKARGNKAEGEVETDEDAEAAKLLLSFEGMVLDEVVGGPLKHVKDTAGNELSMTPEAKAALLQNSWARDALFTGYMRSLKARGDDSGN